MQRYEKSPTLQKIFFNNESFFCHHPTKIKPLPTHKSQPTTTHRLTANTFLQTVQTQTLAVPSPYQHLHLSSKCRRGYGEGTAQVLIISVLHIF